MWFWQCSEGLLETCPRLLSGSKLRALNAPLLPRMLVCSLHTAQLISKIAAWWSQHSTAMTAAAENFNT